MGYIHMSSFRSEIPSIQEELDHYVQDIMDTFVGNGEFTKEQVLNYLIEKINQELFDHVETEGATIEENALHKLLGTPEGFTKKLLASKNLEWPSVGWHENKTSINDSGDINRFANIISPIVMKGMIVLHIALVIVTGVFISFFIIETIITIEYSTNIYYWYRSIAMDGLIITYSLIGAILYPITALVSKKPFFRYSWDNMNQWVNIIEITKKIQLVTYNLYIIFFFSSTVIYQTEIIYDNTTYAAGTIVSTYYGPMNGYMTTDTFISLISPFLFILYLGVSYYKNNIHGSELRPILKSDKYKFRSNLAIVPFIILLYYILRIIGFEITRYRHLYYNIEYPYFWPVTSAIATPLIWLLIINTAILLLVKFNKISLIHIKSNMIKINQIIAGILPFTFFFNYLQYDLLDLNNMSRYYIPYFFLILVSIALGAVVYAYFYRRILEKIIILLKLNERMIEKKQEITGVDKVNA
jgi:hypothetical protein